MIHGPINRTRSIYRSMVPTQAAAMSQFSVGQYVSRDACTPCLLLVVDIVVEIEV